MRAYRTACVFLVGRRRCCNSPVVLHARADTLARKHFLVVQPHHGFMTDEWSVHRLGTCSDCTKLGTSCGCTALASLGVMVLDQYGCTPGLDRGCTLYRMDRCSDPREWYYLLNIMIQTDGVVPKRFPLISSVLVDYFRGFLTLNTKRAGDIE